MNTQFNTKHHIEWALEYQEFLESGMTQPEWCSLKGVKLSTFQYRITELRKLYEPESATYGNNRFARLTPPLENPGPINTNAAGLSGTDGKSYIILEYGNKKISIPNGISDVCTRLVLEVFLNA